MVHRGVKAQRICEQAALFVCAGDANDTATDNLPHLPNQMADGAGRGGNDKGLPRLWLAQIEQPEVAGEPVGAVHPQVVRGIVDLIHHVHGTRLVNGVLLPPRRTGDQRAGGDAIRFGCLHPSHRRPTHHNPTTRRPRIAGAPLQASALAGTNGKRQGATQDLAGCRHRRFHLAHGEVSEFQLVLR